jgi:hypothetical protein
MRLPAFECHLSFLDDIIDTHPENLGKLLQFFLSGGAPAANWPQREPGMVIQPILHLCQYTPVGKMLNSVLHCRQATEVGKRFDLGGLV